jgi:hypothetical protein
MLKVVKATYFNKFFWPTITGLSSVLISFTRMFLGEKDFLVNNIWAEDGLFVVCNLKSNVFSCLTDSYSGYSLLYPRIISFIVHYFSVDKWALVNNILYFIVIFSLSFLVYSILEKEYSKSTAFMAVVIPFTLAISSDQILNVHSSLYLIVTAYLVIIFSNNAWLEPKNHKIYFALVFTVFLHAASTPFGIIVLFIILFKTLINRKVYELKKALILSAIVGNALQIMVITFANEVRGSVGDNLLVLKNSFNYFLKSVISIFYYPANLKLDSEVFSQQSLVSFLYSHVYLLVLIIISISVLPFFIKGPLRSKFHSISIVMISLIAILIISSKTFGWPYRFLVLTSTLIVWVIISLISLIQVKIIRLSLLSVTVIAIFYNSFQSFAVSPYRAKGPKWIGEIQSKTLLCQSKLDKDELIGLTFYPNWPTINPHTYRLTEPTTNEISCVGLLKSIR